MSRILCIYTRSRVDEAVLIYIADSVQSSCPQGCILKTPVNENVLTPIGEDLSAHEICKAADAETMGLRGKV